MITTITTNEQFFLDNIELTNGNIINYTPSDRYMDCPPDYYEDEIFESLASKGIIELIGYDEDGRAIARLVK